MIICYLMKYFFCFGYPKSGTTYLQMLLESHPELSCPAEHKLYILFDGIAKLFTGYNKELIKINKKMSNKDLVLFKNEDIDTLVKFVAELTLKRGGQNKVVKLNGVKDNLTLSKNLSLFIDLFPKEKFIMIVRDPRHVGISLWHYRKVMLNDTLIDKANTIDEYAIKIVDSWAEKIININQIINRKPNNFFICKYENLNKENNELKKIFKFLSVNYEDKIVSKILDSNSFEKFKDNKFFRKGFSSNWQEELKPSTNKKIIDKHGNLMKKYGYLN